MNAIEMSKNEGRDDEILLPDGLVGLPRLQRWLLVDNDPPLPLRWLQSLDQPGFRLPVTSPVYFDPDYGFDLDDEQEERLSLPEVEDVAIMIVTTVHPGGERITGNMAAPIVVNTLNRKGLQCILDERKYSLHAEIDSVRFGLDLPAEDSGDVPVDGETHEPEPVLTDG